VLTEEYDIVLTYFGVLSWLPDLGRWAEIVAHLLKAGGFLYVAGLHPFVNMIEGGDPAIDAPYLAYTYSSNGWRLCPSRNLRRHRGGAQA
jgi:hypothetical protein